MKSSGIKTSTVLASFLLAACLSMRAEVKLPAIFSDGMVMQQQTNANLWGTATPNKKVTVTTGWNGKQYAVTADKNGFMETFSLHSGSRRTVYHHFRRWNPKDTE